MQLSGKCLRKNDKGITWQWLFKSDLKIRTEALLYAAEEQTIRMTYVKHNIDKNQWKLPVQIRWKKCESVQHLVSGCYKLAEKEFKRQHENVAKKVHWDISKKNGLEYMEKWYGHVIKGVGRSESVVGYQCSVWHVIVAWRQDIIVIDKKQRKGIITNTAVSANVRVGEKERKKWKSSRTWSRACSDKSPWKRRKRIW